MKKIAIVFVILALALALFSGKTYADSATGNVTITNALPTIGTVTLYNQADADAAITLASGSTVTVTANVTVTDLDGGGNIASATGKLYHSTNTSASADNENAHITNSSCALSGVSGNDVIATCKFTMDYMALNGTWTVNITAADGSASVSAQDTNTVNDLAALDVTQATIEFGNIALGGNSSSATTMTVKSQGNVQIDARYKGTNYSCTSGTIPVGNTRYSTSTGNYDSMATDLTEGDVTQASFDLTYRTGGSDSTKNEYWTIKIPDSGVSGTCSNTLTVTAIAG